MLRGIRDGLAGTDVTPVGVGPRGVIEAAVEEAELARLQLHVTLEAEAPAPEREMHVFNEQEKC